MVSQDTPSLRSIGDIHDMLVRWTRENNTTDWTIGIQRLLFQKNRQDHVGIKRSPYETMFGCAPKVDLSTTLILNEILQVLQKEEDLQAHLNDKPSDNANSNVKSVEDNNSNDTNNISWEIDMGYKFNIFEKPIQAVHFSWFVQNRSRFEH